MTEADLHRLADDGCPHHEEWQVCWHWEDWLRDVQETGRHRMCPERGCDPESVEDEVMEGDTD